MTFTMTCSCGDVMSVQGETRAEAAGNLEKVMNKEAVTAHMAAKHPGEAVPTMEQVHAMIEQGLQAAA